MPKRVEEEDIWNKKMVVSDGTNALKEIFKADYERTKELDKINIYVSAEWVHIVKLLKKRLRVEGTTRQGTHFIRRRLTIAGLQLLQNDNTTLITKQQKEYDAALEIYDSLSCILAAQVRNIYPREALRTSLYLQEETMGWIQDFSDMLNLTTYSVIRPTWSYAILKLIEIEYLPDDFSERPKQDIKLFKEYISRKF